jgi:hypothetical protein
MRTDLGFARALCAEFPNDNPELHGGAIWFCARINDDVACELPEESLYEESSTTESLAERLVKEVGPEAVGADAGLVDGAIRQHADDPGVVAALEVAVPERSEPAAELAAVDLEVENRQHADDSGPVSALEPPSPAEAEAIPDVIAAVEEGLDDDDLDPAIEVVDDLSFDAIDESPADDPPVEDPFAVLLVTLEDAARALGAADDAVIALRALFGATRAADLSLDTAAEEALAAGGIVVRGARGLARSPAFTDEVMAWQGILRGESEDFSLCVGTLDEWTANVVARLLGNVGRAEGIRRELRRRGIAAFGLVSAAA